MEKPAYWRIVHGRTAYIVACGPRRKGSKPGNVFAWGRSFTSSAVYSGLTAMPSGVTQFSATTSPPGADLAAALCQSARVEGLKGAALVLMATRAITDLEVHNY